MYLKYAFMSFHPNNYPIYYYIAFIYKINLLSHKPIIGIVIIHEKRNRWVVRSWRNKDIDKIKFIKLL